MRIMITGALGHIGSKVIHSLKEGMFEEVRLLDNLSTNRYPSLFHLPEGVPFKFREGDIRTADLDEELDGVDVVVHLAAVTDAATSFERPREVEEVNLHGTRRVAEACLRRGCRLLFPSTTSVYGTQKEVVDEDCPEEDLKPQSPYAESKLRAERLLEDLGARGLDFVICRFGTIFGPSVGMRFHTAVNRFVWQACLGRPITVWRTALHQKRPYLDLEDAVRAVFFIVERGLFDGRIYNVVTANHTVNDIVVILRDFLPAVAVEFVDSPIMNQLSYHVRGDRFRGVGFTYRGDLRRGIGETLRFLKGIINVTEG
ncbi:MAG TPA: SDR family oxidoreductase [Syntrophales bacterium]|nr:SDR family oxidoreductase [Syntrophales bacterium]HOM07599.1 SDR family oxidoreductase [Syntrophales bacterium]HOO00196.1 SDR family oxidoreductase [Syntrophales bacterium]HPQ07161.1 SDR family oxidoreductase [Syntrophales bacterium]HRS87497.1 SDR family oxidoreductase [Syntrophales bacterium]